MAKKLEKTNVMRILEQAHIPYRSYTYSHRGNEAVDGASVAAELGQSPQQVFKTLVTKGNDGNHYVFVIPVAEELDLKAAAKAVGVKSVEMIPVAQINRATGYIRGGCSPIGMKKLYTTVVDQSALSQETIIFSGGKIGFQVEIAPEDLSDLIHASFAPICRK